MPFLIELLPTSMRPNIEWRGVPFLTGLLTTVVQVLAGVGGLFLDIFFQKSMLDRKTTNATKAVVQSFSHVVRGIYFIVARRHRQRAVRHVGARDPARDRRHLARALRDRAHDRSRLSAMDAGHHLCGQRRLSGARRHCCSGEDRADDAHLARLHRCLGSARLVRLRRVRPRRRDDPARVAARLLRCRHRHGGVLDPAAFRQHLAHRLVAPVHPLAASSALTWPARCRRSCS